MEYEFLKQFAQRMKHVGMYAELIQGSFQKTTWKQYGFQKTDEQLNIIFAVLLYVMEQSLKDEPCTMDDIGAYIDTINGKYFRKELTYDTSKELGEFIINVILCSEGKAMYFDCYDFEQKAYKIVNINYIANRIIYVDSDVKRTSYYVTDDGYNLILSTLEIENNMKLTIHEMIFQMHLEKASYDKAVDDIKNIFNLLRIQFQKIQEAMGKIRRNALGYSVTDYRDILEENLETISDTKIKFQNYKDVVKTRVKELEEENINVRKLQKKEEESLKNLRIIESYLNRTIDEHQKILNRHFDLKSLYTKELEQLSQMSLIKRFSLRNELYEKVMEHAGYLEHLDYFLRPLFNREIDKSYNLNKALEFQRKIGEKEEEEEESILDFDEERWEEEQEQRLQEKLQKYEKSLTLLLESAVKKGSITLQKIKENPDFQMDILIPDTEIFKEIMVELLKNQRMEISILKQERSENISDYTGGFQLNEMLLDVIETNHKLKQITTIEVYRIEDGSTVVFQGIQTEPQKVYSMRCSNVLIQVTRSQEAEKYGI
ncbi:MAG: hypothetical protein RR139_03480 [Lachnospiraceae bacterium]